GPCGHSPTGALRRGRLHSASTTGARRRGRLACALPAVPHCELARQRDRRLATLVGRLMLGCPLEPLDQRILALALAGVRIALDVPLRGLAAGTIATVIVAVHFHALFNRC